MNSVSSVYIHIPFCSSICSYCDFAKVYYNSEIVSKYLVSLKKEIELNYKGEQIKTLYIGGGTPSSLNIIELSKLFDIISVFNLDDNIEFTFECNAEDMSIDKLNLLKSKGVNRLSIGVQSFNEKHLMFLNRHHNEDDVIKIVNDAKKIGFNNISVDLIYGLPNQTLDDLESDINKFLSLDINHISCYSLIVEEHTILFNNNIKNINEDLDYEMYQLICSKLKSNGYLHYEISNFGKENYQSKHNLVYWNNEHYYGFGIGASGYIDNLRYDNTKSFKLYNDCLFRMSEDILDIDKTISNEFILGLRKIDGVDKEQFRKKYNIDINSIKVVNELIKNNNIVDNGGKIYIDENNLYISNNILEHFID